jgi:CheY-like chemotaxis protein
MGYRCLVVDDDKRTADFLADQLRLLNHTVVVAYGPRAALAQLNFDRPDIVFLDVNMPGIDGLEICRFLRRDPRTRNIPIIVVSANEEKAHQEAAHLAGANYYIVKPAMLDDVEKALVHITNSAKQPAAPLPKHDHP